MKKLYEYLNDEQIQAVKHFNGPCVVVAGPGTGKTTVITYRILNLIKEYKVNPKDILVVTFTKAAAKEMKDRFSKLNYYKKEYNGVTFGTFHSVFYRILRTYKNYKLEDLLDEKGKRIIIKSIIKVLGYDFYEDEQLIENVIREISYVQNIMGDIDDFESSSVDNEILKAVKKEYDRYKRNNEKYDYDDILTHCYELLCSNEKVLNEIRSNYKYILIDEFQDINRVQFEIMKNIAFPRNNIFVVGDDDQSIYGFRGAEPIIMFEFSTMYKGAAKIILTTNYRSSKAIINSAMSLICNNRYRYEKKFVTMNDMGSNPLVVRVEDFEEEAKEVSKKIKEKVEKGKKYSEIAVIYRTNIQSRAFIDAFTAANIPYVCYDGTASIYNHWMQKDILSYLKAAVYIDRNNSLLRIINKPNRYISRLVIEESLKEKGDLLDNIINCRQINDLQRKSIYQLKDSLVKIKDMPTGSAVKFIKKNLKYEEYIRDYAHGKFMSYKLLKELLEEINNSAKKFDYIADYIEYVNKIVKSLDYRNTEPKNLNAVSLMTMHKAKGLEFEEVFISGAVEGIIPYIKEDKIELKELEDERRLFYVAMTRAKKALYIIVPKYRFNKKVFPSRFIEEMESWLKDYNNLFKCGEIINHKYFGEGIIKNINMKSGKYTITVEFENTTKKLNLKTLIEKKIIDIR